MTPGQARFWLTKATLWTIASLFVFLSMAPVLSFPLQFDESLRLLEITLPVFLSYLGSATQYAFGNRGGSSNLRLLGNKKLVGILVRGPVFVFATAIMAALVAFGVSNSKYALQGTGMSLDALAAIVSAALGILTISTTIISGRIFAVENQTSGGGAPQ